MRELKQDWRDLFGGFKVAFDVWKIFLALAGLVVTVLVFWGIFSLRDASQDWVVAIIVAALILIVLAVKFATSESGFTATKAIMWFVSLLVVGGVTVLFCLWGRPDEFGVVPEGSLYPLIVPGSVIFFGYLIWALFGGAISRIAVVEISTDDRIGLGEALCYANRKYTAYLGSTLLPLIAVLMLMICTFIYGLLFRLPVVNVILACFFFLVLLDGFLMFLIFLGGVAGVPLMYPAVSAEGNDAFDAISRSYSYVFGRPWRFLWYNLMAFIYGAACILFVGIFVSGMLWLALGSVDLGTGGKWSTEIKPQVVNNLQPLLQKVSEIADRGHEGLASVDSTNYIVGFYDRVISLLGIQKLPYGAAGESVAGETLGADASAVIVTIFLYLVIGLVLAYAVSLFFSLQSTIYLLLRKTVDGADVTEVYLEEEEAEEDELAAAAPSDAPKPETPPEQK